jgi:hypothetical protein
MKASNTVVTVIVIAAVLVFAYGVGLLIRQARTGGSHAPVSTEVNDAQRMGPRTPETKDTPEARARIKEERAKAIEKMKSLTEEEKEKFRSQVAKQVSGRRRGKEAGKLPSQVRQAQAVKSPSPSQGEPASQDANAPASPSEGTKTKPDTPKAGAESKDANNAPATGGENKSTKRGNDKAGAEPNKAGPG